MANMHVPSMDAVRSHDGPPEAKRRRLRKGTHSCWECKRRKMKCAIDPHVHATTCVACYRRGTPCISQEFPEHLSVATDKLDGAQANNWTASGDTYGGTTPSTPDEDGRRTARGMLTPSSLASDASGHLTLFGGLERAAQDSAFPSPEARHEKLSRILHASLPSREDTATICSASKHPRVLAHEVMTMPYSTLDQSGLSSPEALLDIPEATSHPVLIARHMLLLATFLQHLDPDLHKEIKGLSESPKAMMERLSDLAAHLMTTNDELIGSIEGLECVMLECIYHANIGNLRRSWVACRRAMSIAQLMGLNRPNPRGQYKVLDPKTKHNAKLMWFRIVFTDRYLCLLLGLTQGSLDRSMASGPMLANDTPMGRLERIHCVIASRILERNESSPSDEDASLLRELDSELQKATMTLPSQWWLPPELDPASNTPQAMFWNTRRAFAQVFHYSLLNQLHLPYMLRSSSSAERKYEYSRITCVNAAREMLSRFIALRRFNGTAYSCRTIDFLALMAAMTLILAHLDSHFSDSENLLAHQYHMDRAMVEKVQENMRELNRLNSDALSAQSADLLHRLLVIDIDTVQSGPQGRRRVSIEEAGSETALPDQNDDAILSVHVPYFGVIKIAREGIRKEFSPQQPMNVGLSPVSLFHSSDGSCAEYMDADAARFSGTTASQQSRGIEAINPLVSTSYRSADTLFGSDLNGTANTLCSDPLFQTGATFPDLAAGTDDWAFQGVDWAFFENLTRGSGNDGSRASE